MRGQGSIPAWADPAALSPDDEREVSKALQPLLDLAHDFVSRSPTNRRQSESEYAYRFRKLLAATIASSQFANREAVQILQGRAKRLLQAIREQAT